MCAANCLVLLSCLMVRMINEWRRVHRGFCTAREKGLSWLLEKKRGGGDRKLDDGWKEKAESSDVSVSAANHKDGHLLNVSGDGIEKEYVTVQSLLTAGFRFSIPFTVET